MLQASSIFVRQCLIHNAETQYLLQGVSNLRSESHYTSTKKTLSHVNVHRYNVFKLITDVSFSVRFQGTCCTSVLGLC